MLDCLWERHCAHCKATKSTFQSFRPLPNQAVRSLLSIQEDVRGSLRKGVLGVLASIAALRACAAWIRGEINCASGKLCQYLRGISLRMAAIFRRAGLKMWA